MALAALARREHSRSELERKLALQGHDDASVDAVLDELEELRLLDEDRFVEAFVRSRVARGQGPVRIAHELKTRGIDAAVVRGALADAEELWVERAQQALSRKFSVSGRLDQRERARRYRFLEFRGFTRSQIAAALVAPDPA